MKNLNNIRVLLGLFIFFVMTLSSCSEDDSVVDYELNKALGLIGEWVCMGDDGEYTLLNLENNHTVRGESLLFLPDSDKTVYLSGIWSYFKKGNVLKIQGEIDNNLQSNDYHYTVKEIEDNRIVLLNHETSSLQTFYRVNSHLDIFMGEKLNGIEVSHVYNERLINPETLEATYSGVCFVESNNSDGLKMLHYVNILHRSEKFMEFLSLSIDDILYLLGTPDASGALGQNQGVLYKQRSIFPYISALQIHYDEGTREVTRILCQYCEFDDFLDDYKYYSENYNLDEDMFYKGNLSSCLEADKVANPIIDGASGFMSYINMTYYITHGYF